MNTPDSDRMDEENIADLILVMPMLLAGILLSIAIVVAPGMVTIVLVVAAVAVVMIGLIHHVLAARARTRPLRPSRPTPRHAGY